jgi:hypothetical protein
MSNTQVKNNVDALAWHVAEWVVQPTDHLLDLRTDVARKAGKLGVKPVGCILDPFGSAEWVFIPGSSNSRFDWAFMPVDNDPLNVDGLPIPGDSKHKLEKVYRSGVRPDELLIAHEVEKGSVRPGQTLSCEDLMPGYSKAVKRQWPVVQAFSFALAGGALRVQEATVARDPILFGAFRHGRLLDLYCLTKWAY